ncbi:MAG: hypothetical protein GY786_05910 [Proteobacteria bacterium]|nr:hypothetical protein [Pseudomonadota bacterium]
MKKKFLFAWFALCLIGISGSALFAIDEFVIEQENEFGGQTTEYIDSSFGILRGVNYYGSDNTKVKEEIEYNEKSVELYGLEKSIRYYFSGIKTQDESYYTFTYGREHLVQKKVQYFDKYSGQATKTEKFFSRDYYGHNITYYKEGLRNRVEWFYPSNIEGIKQHNIYFDSLGERKERVEYIYTDNTITKEGYIKSVYFLEGGRKIKEIWFFNKNYELQNQGITKRVDYYHYTPLKKTVIRSNFFNRQGNLIKPK